MARQARVQGDVTAVIHVRADGSVSAISDVTGSPLLVQTAEALKEWQFFLPKPADTELKITLRFRLEGPERQENVVMKVSATLPNFVEIVTNPTEKPGPDVVPKL